MHVGFQVKVEGPGVSQTGCIVNLQTEFTVDTRRAGEGELKVYAQVLNTVKYLWIFFAFKLKAILNYRVIWLLHREQMESL